MRKHHEKLNKHAAAWILRGLYTNDQWFDETKSKKGIQRNYLFIPLFNIAQSSTKFDLNTLKETCYLLQQNHHINIWGDDYDPGAMLVQLSDEGVQAYQQSFYGRDYSSVIKKGFTAIAAATAFFVVITSANKYYQESKHPKYHFYDKNSTNNIPQKSTVSLKPGMK